MKTKIHVAKERVEENHVRKTDKPVIIIHKDGHRYLANEVKIMGPSVIKYQPRGAVPYDARVWLETDAEVEYE